MGAGEGLSTAEPETVGERWRATLRCAGGEQAASEAFLFPFTKSSVASVNSESLVL